MKNEDTRPVMVAMVIEVPRRFSLAKDKLMPQVIAVWDRLDMRNNLNPQVFSAALQEALERKQSLWPRKSHLQEIEETYFEHMGHALTILGRMLKASAALSIHAFIPEVFKNVASDQLNAIQRLRVGRKFK